MMHKKRKKAIIFTIIGITTVGFLITGVCVMFFHERSTAGIGKSVSDIEYLSLRLSGMRLSEEYEIVTEGNQAQILYYMFSYADGKEEKILKKRTFCSTQTVVEELNRVDFVKWNGFDGKQPKGVMDGTMFRLCATLNGGQSLRANGSQNFPKHFHELEQWLYDMLKDCEEID